MHGAIVSYVIATGIISIVGVARADAPVYDGVKGPPEVKPGISTKIVARVGETVKIVCPIVGNPEPLLEWYKDGDSISQWWDHYRVTSRGTALKIKDVNADDEGTFLCRGINGFGVQEVSMHFKILSVGEESQGNFYPDTSWTNSENADHNEKDTDEENHNPVTSSSSLPELIEVLPNDEDSHVMRPAGAALRLKCIAIGDPLPDFLWLKDGQLIPKQNTKALKVRTDNADSGEMGLVSRASLQIAKLTAHDSGVYSCRAQNSLGYVEASFNVEVIDRVFDKPELHPDYPANTSITVGETAYLQCKVKAELPPSTQWLKLVDTGDDINWLDVNTNNPVIVNKTIRVDNSYFKILSSAEGVPTLDGYYLSKLTIPRSTLTDTGLYMCLAISTAGYVYREVELQVLPDALKTDSGSWSLGLGSDLTLALILGVTGAVIIVSVTLACYVRRKPNPNKPKANQVATNVNKSLPVTVTNHFNPSTGSSCQVTQPIVKSHYSEPYDVQRRLLQPNNYVTVHYPNPSYRSQHHNEPTRVPMNSLADDTFDSCHTDSGFHFTNYQRDPHCRMCAASTTSTGQRHVV